MFVADLSDGFIVKVKRYSYARNISYLGWGERNELSRTSIIVSAVLVVLLV